MISGSKVLWIVGSSIIHWAAVEAGKRNGGKQLGFKTEKLEIHWVGKQGLKFQTLDNFIDQKRGILPTPDYILIHCGANDLTHTDITGKGLSENIKCSLLRYKALFRNMTLIWSSMLQRRYWHHAPLNTGSLIDQKRKRVNLAIKSFIKDNGGKVISHDHNIKAKELSLYRYDGTHLSDLGNQVFLNNIQGGLEVFLGSAQTEFPFSV